MDLFQSENVNFLINFLDANSAPIYSGISGTNIDIYHFSNNSIIFDVSGSSMTQQGPGFQNLWYYNYTISSNAPLTTYNVVYNALFSGSVIQSSEQYNLFPSSLSVINGFGAGTVAVSGNTVDPSGVAVVGVGINIASGMTNVASVTTDVSGNYVAFLNPGSYLLTFVKNGYFTNQQAETVPTLVTNFNFGPNIMIPNTAGSLTISDTYVYKTPSQQVIPIPNLKVSLFANDSPAGNPAIAVAYTNVSGTWIMQANQGNYVLTVAGEVFNPINQNNDRYGVTYNIEVNSAWSGAGITPINFQYLDSSRFNFLS